MIVRLNEKFRDVKNKMSKTIMQMGNTLLIKHSDHRERIIIISIFEIFTKILSCSIFGIALVFTVENIIEEFKNKNEK